jgi:hypothetical protein
MQDESSFAGGDQQEETGAAGFPFWFHGLIRSVFAQ